MIVDPQKLLYRGKSPQHMSSSKVHKGYRAGTAVQKAMYYLLADKIGSVFQQGSAIPFQDAKLVQLAVSFSRLEAAAAYSCVFCFGCSHCALLACALWLRVSVLSDCLVVGAYSLGRCFWLSLALLIAVVCACWLFSLLCFLFLISCSSVIGFFVPC